MRPPPSRRPQPCLRPQLPPHPAAAPKEHDGQGRGTTAPADSEASRSEGSRPRTRRRSPPRTDGQAEQGEGQGDKAATVVAMADDTKADSKKLTRMNEEGRRRADRARRGRSRRRCQGQRARGSPRRPPLAPARRRRQAVGQGHRARGVAAQPARHQRARRDQGVDPDPDQGLDRRRDLPREHQAEERDRQPAQGRSADHHALLQDPARGSVSNLWIKQDEGEGTTLKLMLNEATSPTVEIKDDFVRITVRKPADLPPSDRRPTLRRTQVTSSSTRARISFACSTSAPRIDLDARQRLGRAPA